MWFVFELFVWFCVFRVVGLWIGLLGCLWGAFGLRFGWFKFYMLIYFVGVCLIVLVGCVFDCFDLAWFAGFGCGLLLDDLLGYFIWTIILGLYFVCLSVALCLKVWVCSQLCWFVCVLYIGIGLLRCDWWVIVRFGLVIKVFLLSLEYGLHLSCLFDFVL